MDSYEIKKLERERNKLRFELDEAIVLLYKLRSHLSSWGQPEQTEKIDNFFVKIGEKKKDEED